MELGANAARIEFDDDSVAYGSRAVLELTTPTYIELPTGLEVRFRQAGDAERPCNGDGREMSDRERLVDAIKVSVDAPGTFEVPDRDEASRKQAARLQLGITIFDTRDIREGRAVSPEHRLQ